MPNMFGSCSVLRLQGPFAAVVPGAHRRWRCMAAPGGPPACALTGDYGCTPKAGLNKKQPHQVEARCGRLMLLRYFPAIDAVAGRSPHRQ